MDNFTLGFVLQSPNKIFKICAQYYSLSFPNGKIILKRQNLNVIKNDQMMDRQWLNDSYEMAKQQVSNQG